jgi:hypothetical protein
MFWNFRKRKKAKVVLRKNSNTISIDKQLQNLKQKNAEEIVSQHLLLIGQINAVINDHLNEAKEVHYLVGSRFLRKNYEIFCRSEKESVHLITGPGQGVFKTLSDELILLHEVKELIEAKVFDTEVNKSLQELHFEGYKLWGCFHVHPGCGIAATGPSSIDMELIDKFDAGNYKAVNAIFSRDGFIRFLAPFPFKIHIYGKGVRKINEELYCLVKVSEIPE